MTKRLSRRTFLRGLAAGSAVSLALPTLDAMLDPNGALADGEAGPFLGVFYWANGLPWHAGHGAEQAAGPRDPWTPGTTGVDYAPSELLAELARHRVSVATGLEPHTAVPDTPPGQGDGHMRGFMVALTGDRIRPEGFDHPSHTLTALRPSLDQYVAKHDQFYGTAPPRFRSLVLGASGARFHDYGHWNAISYNGPDSVNLPIMEPTRLYDLLFNVPADFEAIGRRSALLDAVVDDAASLRARLGAGDRARLEAHMEHLFEIQRRFDRSAALCEAPAPPSDGGDLSARNGAMAELLAVALACDLTRVFSYMLTSPATTHVFSNLGVPNGMHQVCHDGQWNHVFNITRYQLQLFAELLDAMANTTDPTGATLMDRGCILGLSEYGEGWKHGVKEMPAVIAGRACGRIKDNVHVREPGGNFSKVHVTALRALGMETPSFGWNGGETSEHLAGILL
jgi:hypothetical protein